MRLSRQKIKRISKQKNQSRKKYRHTNRSGGKLSSPRNRHRNIRYGSLKARHSNLKGGAMLVMLPTSWDAVRTSITNLLQQGALKSVETLAKSILAEPFNTPTEVGALFYSFANDKKYKPLLRLVWGNNQVSIKAFRYFINLGVPSLVSSILDPLRIELQNTINTGDSTLSEASKRQKYLVICFYRKLINLIVDDLNNTQETFGTTIGQATQYRSDTKIFQPKEIDAAETLINSALSSAIKKGKTYLRQASSWMDSNLQTLKSAFPNIEAECEGIIDVVGNRELPIPSSLKEAVCDMGELRETAYCIAGEQPPSAMSADDALSLLKNVPKAKEGSSLQEQLANQPEKKPEQLDPSLKPSQAPQSTDIDSGLFDEGIVGKQAATAAKEEAERFSPSPSSEPVAPTDAPKPVDAPKPIDDAKPADKEDFTKVAAEDDKQINEWTSSRRSDLLDVLSKAKLLAAASPSNDGKQIFDLKQALSNIESVLPEWAKKGKSILVSRERKIGANPSPKAKEYLDSLDTKIAGKIAGFRSYIEESKAILNKRETKDTVLPKQPTQKVENIQSIESTRTAHQNQVNQEVQEKLKAFLAYFQETKTVITSLKEKLNEIVASKNESEYNSLSNKVNEILTKYEKSLQSIAVLMPNLNKEDFKTKSVPFNNLLEQINNMSAKTKLLLSNSNEKLRKAPSLSPAVEQVLNKPASKADQSLPFKERLKAFRQRFTRKNNPSTNQNKTRKAKRVTFGDEQPSSASSAESSWMEDSSQRASEVAQDIGSQTPSAFLSQDKQSPAQATWLSDAQKRQAALREAMANQLQASANEKSAASKEKRKSSFSAANPLGVGLGLADKMPSLSGLFGKKSKSKAPDSGVTSDSESSQPTNTGAAEAASQKAVTLVRDALGDLKNIEDQLAELTQEVKSNKQALTGRLSGSSGELGGDVQASLSADKEEDFNTITIKVRYPKDGASTITPNTGSSAATAMTELVRHISLGDEKSEVSTETSAEPDSEEEPTSTSEQPASEEVTSTPSDESKGSSEPSVVTKEESATSVSQSPIASTEPSVASTETLPALEKSAAELSESADKVESESKSRDTAASRASTPKE